MIIYDLILVCGSNLKPLHSGEKIAVWVQILSFRWRCYRQDLTPGYSFSLHCMGWESWDPGGGLVGRLSATSSSRRQCDGGGGSGLFSDSDSFYQLCQLSALPASILGLSEQTKTGATRGRGRQSQGPCSYYWRRRIQYTSRLVFAFFWLNYRWCIFAHVRILASTGGQL